MRARNRFALVLLTAALVSGIALRAHAAAGVAPVIEEMSAHMEVTRVRSEPRPIAAKPAGSSPRQNA
jgi:hypothetical protein